MRNAFGYILGFLVFVAGIPALRFTRNPMLMGVYIYDIGVLIWLQSWWPIAVFAVEVILLTLQVHSEEKRLEDDFGQEYKDYKKNVPRYL